MASFNVSPQPRDPGPFRVGEGQPAFDFGSVIKGIGNLFETAVVEKDNSNINQITNEVNRINQEASSSLFGSSDTPTAPAPDTSGTGLIGAGSSTPKAPNEPLPPELAGIQSELARLKAAKDQNKISSSAYLSRLETASKEIRSRFPGYGDKIDDIIKTVTGLTPAKELLRIQEKEMEDAKKEYDLVRKQGMETFEDGLKKGLWSPQEIEILRQNVPSDQVQAYMTRRLGEYYRIEADRAAVASKKADVSDAALRAARFTSDMFLGKLSTATGNPTWKQLQEKMNQFAGMSPQQRATATPELLMQINMVKAQAKQQIISELSKTDSNGNSYISLINDKSKVDGIISQAMLEVDTMAEAVTNNDYGLAASVKAYIQAREDGWKLEKGPSEILQKLKAIGVPNEAIASAMYGSPWLNKMMDAVDVAMTNQGIGVVTTEPNKPLSGVITDTNKVKQNAEVSKAILEQPVNLLMNPQVNAKQLEVTIDNIFGQGNYNILDTAKTPEQKKYLYDKLTNPGVTSRIIALSKEDPNVLTKYENFVVATSRSLLAQDLATLRQTTVDKNAAYDVKFENGRFSVVLNDIGKKQVSSSPVPLFGSLNPQLEKSIENINNVLGVLRPVWEAKGGNPEQMTQVFLGVMGVDPQEKKAPTFFEQITRAITGNNDPKKVMDDIKSLEAELDKAKKRVELGRPFAKSDVTRIEEEIKSKSDLVKELTAGTPPAAMSGQERPNFTAGIDGTQATETPAAETQPNEPRIFPNVSTPQAAPTTPVDLPRMDQPVQSTGEAPSASPQTPQATSSQVDPRRFAGTGPDGTFNMEAYRNARVDAGENPNTRANLDRPAAPVVSTGSVNTPAVSGSFGQGGARSIGAARRASFSSGVNSAINQAASAAGIDPNILMAFADIESGGRPNVTTGSYKGLFQLSEKEFRKYGGKGDIYDPVENARVAAIKLKDEATRFEKKYGRPAEPFDIYMVHQQGWEGYARHLENPEGKAWENMFRTGEGRQKGKKWAKMAIWGNIPTGARSKYFGMPKSAGKGLYSGIEYVDNVTSADFMRVWKERMSRGLR